MATAAKAKRYRILAELPGGGSGSYPAEAVIEVPEDEELPEGAEEVPDDTPLQDFQPVK